MRRTKQWWSRLSKRERSRLVELEHLGSGPYGAGGYLPDDCTECNGCGEPQVGSGLCSQCCREHKALILKASKDVYR